MIAAQLQFEGTNKLDVHIQQTSQQLRQLEELSQTHKYSYVIYSIINSTL